ncbi:hypothetical protein PG990_001956 [Apiospora arundinis]|uniref:2-hydroxyacylsphingosine 1-beta-galactosyltransferase n=1 Tax=Apiospora arundinis TaxID=335852 RepID=A0ABR2I454_9PEZI
MLRNIGRVALVFIVGLAAVLFQLIRSPPVVVTHDQVQGKNNTALFIINTLNGLHNVHIATIQALQEKHPHVKVHVLSWSPIESKVKKLGGDVEFHALAGQWYIEALADAAGFSLLADFAHPLTVAGWLRMIDYVQLWMGPWSGPAHLDLIQEMGDVVDQLDPAVVVLDTFMWPGIDMAREKKRLHAYIVPNMLADNFVFMQPWLGGYWKFAAISSNLPFPIPWSKIPQNVLHSLLVRYGFSWTPRLRSTKKYLWSNGIRRTRSSDFYDLYRQNTPWISQALPEASIPVDYVPPNVTCTGPIVSYSPPLTELDPKLALWLQRGPTVLVNLGNTVSYDEIRATAFIGALNSLLDSQPTLQVLWKFQKAGTYSDDMFSVGKKHLESGRLRMVSWLDASPAALLKTGDIKAFVHHGGAGSYHDAILTGVPHIVLPLWADHYNIASLVEYLHIGVQGCKEISPRWTSECLVSAISRVIDESEAGKAIHQRAHELGRIAQASPGRYGAAQIVAELAGTGHT